MKKIVKIMLSTVLMFSMFNSNVIHASNKSSKYTEKEVELLKESKRIDELQINQVLTNLDNQLYTNRSSNTLTVKEELRAYRSSSQLGSYGDILINLISDSGSIGFAGHAGIVANNNWQTIESFAKDWSPIKKDGVQKYTNNWRRKGSLLYRPVGATISQYKKAASYAESKVGKPYNWNFFDKKTTNSFYCSQLVWLAWLDAGIDIEKGSFPNGVVSPADLANSSNTYLVERIR